MTTLTRGKHEMPGEPIRVTLDHPGVRDALDGLCAAAEDILAKEMVTDLRDTLVEALRIPVPYVHSNEDCEHYGDVVLTEGDLRVIRRLMRSYAHWHLGNPHWGDHFMAAVEDPLTLRQQLRADKRS